MRNALRIQLEGIKVSFYGRMAYRGDFFISTFIMLAFELIVPLVTLLIYSNGSTFPGWSLYEALLIQGIFMLSKGIAFPFFFGIVWNVMNRVREGTFDLLLIKPGSILHLSIATAFDSEDLGKLFGGIILFTVSVANVPLPGILQWIQFILLFAVSLIVFFSIALILSGILFKWVGCSRIYEIFNSITSFSMYPRTIFSKGLQTIITVFVPVAMMGSFPASALLGRPMEGIAAALASSGVFLVLSLYFWHFMLGKYTSAGG